MENGISKHWTPEAEAYYEGLLARRPSFAERSLIMSLRDLLKYDGRSRGAKRAIAQARLRFSTASDEDLKELAYIETIMTEPIDFSKQAERFNNYKKLRDAIREKGIKRSELACR